MNKVYRSIYSEHTGTFVAVSENTKARGKRSSSTSGQADSSGGSKLLGLQLKKLALAPVFSVGSP